MRITVTMLVTGSPFYTSEELYNVTTDSSVERNTHLDHIITNTSVVEAASDYLIYKIGWALHIYYVPVMCIIGTCGNIMSFRIMSLVQNSERF